MSSFFLKFYQGFNYLVVITGLHVGPITTINRSIYVNSVKIFSIKCREESGKALVFLDLTLSFCYVPNGSHYLVASYSCDFSIAAFFRYQGHGFFVCVSLLQKKKKYQSESALQPEIAFQKFWRPVGALISDMISVSCGSKKHTMALANEVFDALRSKPSWL